MKPHDKPDLRNRRMRSTSRGLSRFEVLARPADRALIQLLALRLVGNDALAADLRAALDRAAMSPPPTTGGILATLRRSPLVGADLELGRTGGVQK